MTPDKASVRPNGLPTYRLLTGPDDAAFCHRVSEALALACEIYGPPAATFNGENVIVAQAIIWPSLEAEIAGRNDHRIAQQGHPRDVRDARA